MFVAWRDLLFARGRFTLITSVVLLITLLIGLLSGLMMGLRGQNVSAVEDFNTDRVIFSEPSENASLSYTESAIGDDQVAVWVDGAGETAVHPLGVAMSSIATEDQQTSVALFGVESGFENVRPDVVPEHDGEMVLSLDVAEDLGVAAGDTVTLAGDEFSVAAVGGEDWFSHTPVVWLTLADWQAAASAMGDPDAYASVLLASGVEGSQLEALEADSGTVTTTVADSFDAIGGFSAENGSLMAMLGMLLVISGLVIGAFFTVWTIQRTSDVAILKALGASTLSLVRDALGQAVIVLAIGVGVGVALTVIIGRFVGQVVPFVLSLSTTLVPGALLIAMGLIGAAFALRIIVKSDPLAAIGSNR